MVNDHKHDEIVIAWLINSESSNDAHLVGKLIRSVPESGWLIILEILNLTDNESHIGSLATELKQFIINHGNRFIEQIEAEAKKNARFKRCLANVSSDPGAKIPVEWWNRLSIAAGQQIGPVPPHIEDLFQTIPGLSEALYLEAPYPESIPTGITKEDIERIARNWIRHKDTFWAWEEICRIIEEEPAVDAYSICYQLFMRGSSSDHALCALGAGFFEDLLNKHGELIIEQIEKLAATDQRFRFCISHVWPSHMPKHIRERVAKAKGSEPQRG